MTGLWRHYRYRGRHRGLYRPKPIWSAAPLDRDLLRAIFAPRMRGRADD